MTEKIYVLHENPEWFKPLEESLKKIGAPYESWVTIEGTTDLSALPPEGIFFNRLSASSHTRDHRHAIEYAETVMAWLERHGRKTINARHTLTFEARKFDQYSQLDAFGIKLPKTIAAVGKESLVQAVKDLGQEPFIVKPNRGGKGLGVKLFHSLEQLENALKDGGIEECRSLDGVFLVQEYIEAREPKIIRAEFIGGKYHYAVEVDTSEGFELCPADACSIDDKPAGGDFCMADSLGDKFTILTDYHHENIARYEEFLAEQKIDVAAIESIEAKDGTRYTYDINVNTNYNKTAESKTPDLKQGAYDRLAEYLVAELDAQNRQAA